MGGGQLVLRVGPGLLRVVDAEVELQVRQLHLRAQRLGVVAAGRLSAPLEVADFEDVESLAAAASELDSLGDTSTLADPGVVDELVRNRHSG